MPHLNLVQPQTFRMIRAELASMWAPGNKSRQLRRLSTKADLLPHSKDDCTILPENWSVETNEERENMKVSMKLRIAGTYKFWM